MRTTAISAKDKQYPGPEDLDVVILCGGFGKRLQSVLNGVPKSMAPINGKPFLEFLVESLAEKGFQRFILCTGFMGNVIQDYFEDNASRLELVFSQENRSLGTAGAIKNAERLIETNPFVVVNGDSFCNCDFPEFIKFHRDRGAIITLAVCCTDGRTDSGAVWVGQDGRVTDFSEKVGHTGDSFVNAGFYLLDRLMLAFIPEGITYSLELQVLHEMKGLPVYGFPTGGRVVDIGTPERYAEAQHILANFMRGRES